MRSASTPRLARWVGTVGDVTVDSSGLVLSGVKDAWRYEDTVGVVWTNGIVFGDLSLKRADGRSWKATLSKDDGPSVAAAIAQEVRKAVQARLFELTRRYQRTASDLRERLNGLHFLRGSQARGLAGEAGDAFAPWIAHPMLRAEDVQTLPEAAQWWVNFLQDPLRACESNNERWMRREIEQYKVFFDSIGKKGLTEEQRRACVVRAERALVSAAAGSGKTATLVGKVGYLLQAECASPEEILLLAFNRSAAEEIGGRIERDLAPILRGRSIRARTFHAFGLDVLGEATGKRPTVYDPDGEGGERVAWSNLIERLAEEDPRFGVEWWTFRALFLKPAVDPASFRSVETWEEYVDNQGTWTADRRKGFLTLRGEIVKSQGELAIANWLALNGVPYEYERPYEYETADKSRRQYHPDFYLPAIGTYIEHFAVDEAGNPPPAFGEEYARSMEWKRALHGHKGTRLIETTFAQFVDGTLFTRLEAALRQAGQPLGKTPKIELLEALKKQQEVEYPMFLMSVLRPFVSHAKNNRVPLEALADGTLASNGAFREKLFCRLMARLMRAYDSRLRAGNLVDFDDMVLLASDAVIDGRYRSPFKVVLVDEFQDISQARARLVKALADQRDDVMLMGVGDVRQSIYRFAGSDVSVFRHFDTVFGPAAQLKLTKTFRFNQGIADVSSAFVGENDAEVVSDLGETDNVVRVRLYTNRQARAESTAGVLKEIAEEVQREGKRSATVVVLYRVNAIGKDLAALPDFGVLKMEKMSIHRAKGLEADYVVLTGVIGGGAGAFPSKIADDPLLQLVMPEKEAEEAEERRLMYVALTRGRRAAYLVASSSMQSDFVSELIAMKSRLTSIDVKTVDGEEPRICPGCGKGHLVPREGRYGRFLGCSRFPSCRTVMRGTREGQRIGE